MSRPRLIALLLALATLAVYLPAARHGFVNCDDDVYVTANPMVEQGLTWAGVKWAFTTYHGANWHPLTWLSHMTDCEIFKLNPAGPHLVNILFHAANTALLFILLWRLTGLIPPSLLVAALFAWHPLHVESVAWVAERKDVLSTFFALLALLSYVKFAQQNSRRSLWFALIFFALGLLAKPKLVTLPCVLLLLDFWPLMRISNFQFPISNFETARQNSRSIIALLLEKIPFFALTVISCVITFIAQRNGHAVITIAQLPLHYRLENAAVSVMLYLQKMLWPANLAVLYPYAAPSGLAVVVAVLLLVLISFTVWLARNRSRCWLAGWLWFLGTLVPVIGLVQVGAAPMADRYTYLPSIGIFSAVAFGLFELSWGKKLFPVILFLPLIACVVVTERQLGYWRNSVTLFQHVVQVTSNNESAYIDLGEALYQNGRNADALAAYREALRLNPANYHVHFAAGDVLASMDKPAEALTEYNQCLSLAPDMPAVHTAAGRALEAQGNLTNALAEFTKAEELATNYAEPYLECAKIYFMQGLDSHALEELHGAVRAQPDDFHTLATVARYLVANTNDAARDAQGALLLAVKANDLSGNQQPEVLDVLGMAFAANGNFTNAVDCAQNALANAGVAKLNDLTPIQQRLALYQSHQPWRESFRSTNELEH